MPGDDFPAAEGEEGYGEEEVAGEVDYAMIADLFTQLADAFSGMAGGAEEEIGMEEELPPEVAGESTIAEMRSEPEPKELPDSEGNFLIISFLTSFLVRA